MKIEELFTREKSNTPLTVNIGKETIDILGTDSDAFRKAKTEAARKQISGELEVDDYVPWLVAHLIVAWSFEDECSFDNRFSLLKNTPSLCDEIDRVASKRSNFIKPLLGGSSSGAKSASGSGKKSTQKTRKASPAKSTTND